MSRTTAGQYDTTRPPVRVAVVDNDGLLVAALNVLFDEEPSLRFVGGAFTVADGIDLVAHRRPDVLLVDVRMPAGGGVAVAARARAVAPRTVVLAMSASDDPGARVAMAEAGAAGYIVKDSGISELLHTLDVVGQAADQGRGTARRWPGGRPEPVAAGST